MLRTENTVQFYRLCPLAPMGLCFPVFFLCFLVFLWLVLVETRLGVPRRQCFFHFFGIICSSIVRLVFYDVSSGMQTFCSMVCGTMWDVGYGM